MSYRGKKMMELVGQPLVAGPNRRAGLFWFTIFPMFVPEDVPAVYLDKPDVVFKDIWALPDRTSLTLDFLTLSTATA
jgi:hypothetical protein